MQNGVKKKKKKMKKKKKKKKKKKTGSAMFGATFNLVKPVGRP